jgi:hypothetical protein
MTLNYDTINPLKVEFFSMIYENLVVPRMNYITAPLQRPTG